MTSLEYSYLYQQLKQRNSRGVWGSPLRVRRCI